jgi:hypothetical protein
MRKKFGIVMKRHRNKPLGLICLNLRFSEGQLYAVSLACDVSQLNHANPLIWCKLPSWWNVVTLINAPW